MYQMSRKHSMTAPVIACPRVSHIYSSSVFYCRKVEWLLTLENLRHHHTQVGMDVRPRTFLSGYYQTDGESEDMYAEGQGDI